MDQSFVLSEDNTKLVEKNICLRRLKKKIKKSCFFIRKGLLRIELFYRASRNIMLNLLFLYSVFLIPLNISLKSARFEGMLLGIEILIVIILIINIIVDIEDYFFFKGRKNTVFPEHSMFEENLGILMEET